MSTITLGQEYMNQKPTGSDLTYKFDNLVTHGVIFGMTGSGKTGLSITLLESLGQKNVPLILIDPKGDLLNLCLLFDQLSPEQFEPWVPHSEAQQKNITIQELSQQKSELWTKGLEQSHLSKDDVASLKNKLDITVYTPGSTKGVPINLLGSFEAPSQETRENSESYADLISGNVTSLLSLLQIEADPLTDPRHILLAAIIQTQWDNGNSFSLEELIAQVVDPPFQKVGVFSVNTFLSRPERMDLAMKLNAALASKTFEAWRQGEKINFEQYTTSNNGKTPVTIFSIAHLNETERMFFVGRLLEEAVAFSRRQAGSTTLRSLLYFDEVAGYLPPYPASPASKKPILTLMKQARAVGFGVLLATQNPVDIDYKALSNAGSWWIGRLQTNQDRERVLDGLVSATGGSSKKQVTDMFNQLTPRVFLFKEAKSDEPKLFHTRWAMSYLRGPITSNEISKLEARTHYEESESSSVQNKAPEASGLTATLPIVPSKYHNKFVDDSVAFSADYQPIFNSFFEARREDGATLYRPFLHVDAQLLFDESKGQYNLHKRKQYIFELKPNGIAQKPVALVAKPEHFNNQPNQNALFYPLPEYLDESSEFSKAGDFVKDYIYREVKSARFVHPELKIYSQEEETEDSFRKRVQEQAESNLEDHEAKLKKKFEKKINSLEKKLKKAEDKIERYSSDLSGRRMEQVFTIGKAVLGFFTGRGRSLSATLSKSRMASNASSRLDNAEENKEELEIELEELQEELELELENSEAFIEELLAGIIEESISLEKSDIDVTSVGILWLPVSRPV